MRYLVEFIVLNFIFLKKLINFGGKPLASVSISLKVCLSSVLMGSNVVLKIEGHTEIIY